MFCEHCGRTLDNEAKFCDGCGTKITSEETNVPAVQVSEAVMPLSRPAARSKPAKRKKHSKESKPLPIPARILFVILAVLIGYFAVSSTVIFLFGKTASPDYTSQSRRSGRDNSQKNDYSWDVHYEFIADSETYSGYVILRGGATFPDRSGLQVCYLPLIPQINTLADTTLADANDIGEVMGELLKNVLTLVAAAFICFVLLKVALKGKKRKE